MIDIFKLQKGLKKSLPIFIIINECEEHKKRVASVSSARRDRLSRFASIKQRSEGLRGMRD